MFSEVHTALGLDVKSFQGLFIHIHEDQDQLGAFLIHHFLSCGLQMDRSILFLGLEQSLGHYHSVSLKLGRNLLKSRSAGQVMFLEVLKEFAATYREGLLSVDRLQQKVRAGVEELLNARPGKGLMIIIDKLSLLQSYGLTNADVLSLVRDILSTSMEHDATLVILTRASDADTLNNYLSYHAETNVHVWPLKTGRSKNVTGNLQLESPGTCKEGRYQFMVEEKNVRIFALGASRGVL